MHQSFLLQCDAIEDIYFMNNHAAKSLSQALGIELDIFYDSYSNMEMSNKICEMYHYPYDDVEKLHGFYIQDTKFDTRKIVMKTDKKGFVYIPTLFHELGHFIEGYLCYSTDKDAYLFWSIKTEILLKGLEKPDPKKAHMEITEYIANCLGLFLAARVDFLSRRTRYFYPYFNGYKRAKLSEMKRIGDILFNAFVIDNEAIVDIIQQSSSIISPFDYEYAEFISMILHDISSKLKYDFTPVQEVYEQKICALKKNQSTYITDALLSYIQQTEN